MAQPDLGARRGDPGAEAKLHISLLGPLALSRAGSVIELSGPKRRALLTLLALNAGAPVSRERIVEAMWPRGRTGREDSTLQVHVSHLRDHLEATRTGHPTVLLTEGAGYMLSSRATELDIDHFDRLASQARSLLPDDPAGALEKCDEALHLWRGRPLQDVEYEEFAQDEIRRLDLVRGETVINRAESLVELGMDAEAIEVLEGPVRADSAAERPIRLLMTALYRTGRQADSLRVFRRHARRLAEQGLDPSPQVADLEEGILQHDPGLLPRGLTSPRDVRAGRSIRGYELREEVGSGSIGVVYRAFQAVVGREVAVKVVDPDLAQSPEFVRKFSEEARLIGSLEHPHIVPLHDFWREPAGAFLVMRWMVGGSLQDRMAEPMPLHQLGQVFDQLADALGYAHSAGVVHRNLKPDNVLFDGQGNAYLCDFSMASAGRETEGDAEGTPRFAEDDGTWPEHIRRESPTVASDILGLGILLGQAATGGRFRGIEPPVPEDIREVVLVATALHPGDRYPDLAAFRAALRDAVEPAKLPAPRRVRRNPYKGLEPFEEGDRADFYGREAVVETLVGLVGAKSLVAVIGASGSGKSSLVKAGLIPQIRQGALRGSEEWAVVHMVPGSDPFEGFHLGLRDAAVGHANTTSGDRELRRSFSEALDSPNDRAVLVIDQFEEVFSSEIEEATRQRFLDNLVDLTLDPAQRIKVVLTLRADFSDRPLSHPRFGDVISRGSFLLGPMGPEQIEEVIRLPAARVGVQVEPGLIAEIVRDVASAPAYLPLLQYTLSELFERRREDRLTVAAYRSLGGVDGVLERQAESTYAGLSTGAREATRQLFLRMVHVGEHGEETRRRVPVTDLRGLRDPGDVDEALESFAAARLITYDRDPVSRIPTIEVAHETVIGRWTRFRVWVEDARSALRVHRRLAAAAQTWTESDEDPSYLLTGGPLVAALELDEGSRIVLNDVEARYLAESEETRDDANRREADRLQEEVDLRQRAKRRLALGIAAGAVAVVVAFLAVLAVVERQRADALAQAQERQSLARSLAAAATAALESDPELGFLLALEGAELSLDAGEEPLPEVVDALHRSVIAPKSELVFDLGAVAPGRGHLFLDWSRDGSVLAVVDRGGGVTLIAPATGAELGRLAIPESPMVGVRLHPSNHRAVTIHGESVIEWSLSSFEPIRELPIPGGAASAAYSTDGDSIAVGGSEGAIHIWSGSGEEIELRGHEGSVTGLAFSPDGGRLVSGGADNSALVWDLATGEVITTAPGQIVLPVLQVAWAPGGESIAIVLQQGETYLFDARTGERGVSLSSGATPNVAVSFDQSGAVIFGAASDGLARGYSSGTGGAPVVDLPHGGARLRAVVVDPTISLSPTIATLDGHGFVRIWRRVLDRSELPVRATGLLYPVMSGVGDRYLMAGYEYVYGLNTDQPPFAEVIDAGSGDVLLRTPVHRSFALFRQPAITRDGLLVAVPGQSGDVELIPVDGGEPVVIAESASWTNALTFDDRGSYLVGAGLDGSIAVWETDNGDLVEVISTTDVAGLVDAMPPAQLPATTIDDVTFRPGTVELAWARLDGRVGSWDLATGEGRILGSVPNGASSIAYRYDGAVLAVASSSGEILLLDADSAAVLGEPDPVPGDTELAFSPDGRHLAGAGPGPYAHLWDASSGSMLRQFRGAIGSPRGVAFVNEGLVLRVAGSAGFDRGYLIDPTDLVELARQTKPRDLTEVECLRYLSRACLTG